jgi:hypothetical protein
VKIQDLGYWHFSANFLSQVFFDIRSKGFRSNVVRSNGFRFYSSKTGHKSKYMIFDVLFTFDLLWHSFKSNGPSIKWSFDLLVHSRLVILSILWSVAFQNSYFFFINPGLTWIKNFEITTIGTVEIENLNIYYSQLLNCCNTQANFTLKIPYFNSIQYSKTPFLQKWL